MIFLDSSSIKIFLQQDSVKPPYQGGAHHLLRVIFISFPFSVNLLSSTRINFPIFLPIGRIFVLWVLKIGWIFVLSFLIFRVDIFPMVFQNFHPSRHSSTSLFFFKGTDILITSSDALRLEIISCLKSSFTLFSTK